MEHQFIYKSKSSPSLFCSIVARQRHQHSIHWATKRSKHLTRLNAVNATKYHYSLKWNVLWIMIMCKIDFLFNIKNSSFSKIQLNAGNAFDDWQDVFFNAFCIFGNIARHSLTLIVTLYFQFNFATENWIWLKD
jgi:hypothetical protein